MACGVALVSCGGTSSSPDIGEKAGTFEVKLTRATFPGRQHVAATSDLVLAVQNTGDKALPELAVTIWTGSSKATTSFSVQTDHGAQPSVTDAAWVQTPGFPKVLNDGESVGNLAAAPAGGTVAAQTDTYVFGGLGAGKSRTAVWRVTPVRAGDFTVHYAVSAGLRGDAKAVLAGGGPVGGSFKVKVDGEPRGVCVSPGDGSCRS